jgi:phage baseplate assembly protein W
VCGNVSFSSSGFSFQINTVSPETLYVENCVADGATPAGGRGFQFIGNGFKIVRNNVAINCATCFNGMSLAQGYNNMSSDATAADVGWALGSGNVISVTAADEFESLTKIASDTYLLPKTTGNAKDGGSAPIIAENTHGAVVAIARPHDVNKYSIGGKEYPSSPVITAHPTTQTIAENATATFAVTATDATGYQWGRKEPNGSVWANVTGATSASYTTPVFGATNHRAQYRCTVSNAAGSVVSTEVYLFFTGYPINESPDRPTVANVTLTGLTVSMTVAGTADVFRVEVRRDGTVVAFAETPSAGTLSVNLPLRSVEYVVAVVAANYGSTHWSLPGYTGVWMAARLVPAVSPGVPHEMTASDKVRTAGPLGAGLRFPFRFSSTTGAPDTSVGLDHVVDGMKQVLMTRVNERPIRREFGSVIAGMLFAPDTELSADISNAIQGALADQEHRAEVSAVVFKRDRVKGKVFADIKFNVIRTHQSGNLVYPFEMTV